MQAKLKKKDIQHNEEWILKWAYIGLKESGMPGEVITYLTEKEVIAGCIGAYLNKYKEKTILPIENFNLSPYNLMSKYIAKGMPIINKHNVVGNASKGTKLKERLEDVAEKEISSMRMRLSEEPKEYVTEGQYYHKKKEKGDNHGLEIMEFLPVYMKDRYGQRRDLRSKYAAEICRIIESRTAGVQKKEKPSFVSKYKPGQQMELNLGDLDGAKYVKKEA